MLFGRRPKDSVVLTGAEALARYRCVLRSHYSEVNDKNIIL
jgi:hypothetical protein